MLEGGDAGLAGYAAFDWDYPGARRSPLQWPGGSTFRLGAVEGR
jgi:hypothetical protein